mgnify:CR=1 FL=1
MDNEYLNKEQVRLTLQDLRNKIAESDAKYQSLLRKYELLLEEYDKLKEKYVNLVKWNR